MDKYTIFWIKEEFAYHYFYKNEILYRFLKMYQFNRERHDLLSQYNYITNNFSSDGLIKHFKEHFTQEGLIKLEEKTIKLYNESRNQFISLHINKKHLDFYSKSLNDAEDLLFPTLRLYQPLLFIMNQSRQDFGWISPVMNRYNDENSAKLYSYL